MFVDSIAQCQPRGALDRLAKGLPPLPYLGFTSGFRAMGNIVRLT